MSYELYVWVATILIVLSAGTVINGLLVLIEWLTRRSGTSIREEDVQALEAATAGIGRQVASLRTVADRHWCQDNRLQESLKGVSAQVKSQQRELEGLRGNVTDLRRDQELLRRHVEPSKDGSKAPEAPKSSQENWTFSCEDKNLRPDPQDPYRVIPRGVGPVVN